MTLEVRRFGAPAREMVGLLQRPGAAARRRPAVLLCRPFGQEGTRTAKMYRVIADRLLRGGSAVLSFDYHGTGDSPGEERDQSLVGWAIDIESAHAELAAASDGPVHWFAMGLACHAALTAAARLPSPPAHLVVWEPVLDGPGYVDALLAAHRAELEHEYHVAWPRLLQERRVSEPQLPGDVLGFDVGERFAEELQALRPLPLAPAQRRGVRIACGVHAEHEPALASLPGASSIRVQRIESRMNWMLSQAMGQAIVPPEVMPTLEESFA